MFYKHPRKRFPKWLSIYAAIKPSLLLVYDIEGERQIGGPNPSTISSETHQKPKMPHNGGFLWTPRKHLKHIRTYVQTCPPQKKTSHIFPLWLYINYIHLYTNMHELRISLIPLTLFPATFLGMFQEIGIVPRAPGRGNQIQQHGINLPRGRSGWALPSHEHGENMGKSWENMGTHGKKLYKWSV